MIKPFAGYQDLTQPTTGTVSDDTLREIRSHWKDFYQPDKHGGIICPLCGSGSGKHGSGITHNKNNPGQLRCWNGACNFSGDIFDLIQQDKHLTFSEAVQYAADYLHIQIERDQETAPRAAGATRTTPKAAEGINGRAETKTPGKATETPTEPVIDYRPYYEECRARLQEPAAISYLQARGISLETATSYRLGYDPAWMSPKVISDQEAQGSSWRPPKTRRLIVPITMNHYFARAIDPDVNPDYKKMNETGRGELGIFNQNAIHNDGEPVFVVEGAIDALSIIEAGAAAIGLNSTVNVDLLLRHLSEYPTDAPLIICLDNDDAGKGAVPKLEQGLDLLNIKHITADICGGCNDPNDALCEDRAAFKERIEAAVQAAVREANRDALDDFLDKITSEAYRPAETGLKWFDNLLGGGILPQSLLLLLAAPNTGKTTLLAQLAETLALYHHPVLYLNLEMSREQMLAKAFSARSLRTDTPMTAAQILQGYDWTDRQRRTVMEIAEDYRRQALPYIQYNPAGMSRYLDELLAFLDGEGERAKLNGTAAPIVIVDYLHLISVSNKQKIETQELIKQAVVGLKQYAVKYNTICMTIVATNRLSNSGGKVTLESGRDSSAIEYTADYQLGLNYIDFEQGKASPDNEDDRNRLRQENPRRMVLKLLKARFTEIGRTVQLKYNPAFETFYGTDRTTTEAAGSSTTTTRKPI